MEFTRLINSSLDLNIKPLGIFDELHLPKQEIQSNFIQLGRHLTFEEERGALIEELNRLNAENKKLAESLTTICKDYTELRNQLLQHTRGNHMMVNNTTVISKKRKADESSTNNNDNVDGTNFGTSESSSSDEDSSKKLKDEQIKPKISRTYTRAEASDTSLIVKDGYHWRKYGQKVTRDNPSPRAYFKCSYAPICPVKKKVQRSMEDQSIVLATYEGEHNHPHPPRAESTSGSNPSLTLGKTTCLMALNSSGPTVTPDLIKSINNEETRNVRGKIDAPEPQQYFVEQMASTLTKDPSFQAALVAAISGNFLQQNNQIRK